MAKCLGSYCIEYSWCILMDVYFNKLITSILESYEKNSVILTDGKRGNQNVAVVNESGFYS